MCGIFGHSFQRKAKVPAGQREVLITSLCVANSYRGAQSWGVYVAGQKGKKARVRREVGDIANVAGLATLAAWPVVFGHTRHATTGAITRENQHPFKVGGVLLAHNGMVWNHEELNRKYQRTCTVDSQHFAHHLADSLTFRDIEAYGALEWVDDKRPTSVFLCRMEGGVLAVAGIKNRKGKQVGTAWSSDKGHLERALDASRLDWFWYEVPRVGEVYEVRSGELFTTSHPALILADNKVDHKALRRAQRITAGGRASTSPWNDGEGWWESHYPRRTSYVWDPRAGGVVSTSHNHLDNPTGSLTTRATTGPTAHGRTAPAARPDLSVVGVADATGEEEDDALWASTLARSGLLTDAGAGAPSHRTAADDADDDAEAQRLGLIKMDTGLWSDPETGALVDADRLDALLDAEEDDFTEREDAEEAAWKVAAESTTKH